MHVSSCTHSESKDDWPVLYMDTQNLSSGSALPATSLTASCQSGWTEICGRIFKVICRKRLQVLATKLATFHLQHFRTWTSRPWTSTILSRNNNPLCRYQLQVVFTISCGTRSVFWCSIHSLGDNQWCAFDTWSQTSRLSTLPVWSLVLLQASLYLYLFNREHCTHRVRRLRKTLNLTQPNSKKQNVQKELPEKFNDPRYLYLCVYEVERSWAYAMELKQESTSTMNIRKKHHLIKRLKRASQHAEALYQLCQKQETDNKTNLEIKVWAIFSLIDLSFLC